MVKETSLKEGWEELRKLILSRSPHLITNPNSPEVEALLREYFMAGASCAVYLITIEPDSQKSPSLIKRLQELMQECSDKD